MTGRKAVKPMSSVNDRVTALVDPILADLSLELYDVDPDPEEPLLHDAVSDVAVGGYATEHRALWTPAVRGGELWRLGSMIFMHVSLVHLVLNSLALLQVGAILEVAQDRRALDVLGPQDERRPAVAEVARQPVSALVGRRVPVDERAAFGHVDRPELPVHDALGL